MECAICDTVEYIKILAQNMAGFKPNYVVLAILLDLQMPVNHNGFEYLKAAVLMQLEDPTLDLVNDIYQALAVRYGNISTDMVSSSIHNTIKSAWERGNASVWHRYLPTVPLNKNRAPANAEVIAGLARIVELWQGCSEAYMRQHSQEVVNCGTE